uniref:Uncharacterized protein n=1 Tax=Trichogramma kaykai TaxID=54128 RepID=A0ABD2WDX5_9HYME
MWRTWKRMMESLRSELDSKNTDFLDCLKEFMKSKHNLHKQLKAMIKKAKIIFRINFQKNGSVEPSVLML